MKSVIVYITVMALLIGAIYLYCFTMNRSIRVLTHNHPPIVTAPIAFSDTCKAKIRRISDRYHDGLYYVEFMGDQFLITSQGYIIQIDGAVASVIPQRKK